VIKSYRKIKTSTNKHTGWDYFNYLLENNINLSVQLKTADQLERELNAFTTAIQEAAWNGTPVIITMLKGLNFTKEIRNLIAEKRKLKENSISQEIHTIKIS
jgi:hypothetical protein